MFSQPAYQSRYQILHSLGQGQHGRVFCGMHRQTKELVALKELDRQKFPTKNFLRELGFLVTLQHPNIVSCKGLEYSQTGRFLIMDYCQGGTLRNLMETEKNLDLALSLDLIADILSGLEYARDRNIVHRDIKPENILLESKGNLIVARIADFGIARLGEEPNPTQANLGDTGSPAYMAPEQFYGRYYHSSDLYAVGIILYELIMGERPFSGNFGLLRSSHLNQTVHLDRKIPFLLRSVVSKALQKLPQKRFDSADEMLKSIRLAQAALRSSHA
ncbi:MAG: serine/threonine-protein kinase [Cyanobacteria bacterium P01_G01_bin.19]